MNYVYSPDKELSQLGVRQLTGEACAYSMRVLCDVVSSNAMAGIRDFFYLGELRFADKWNEGFGSIMLANELVYPLLIHLHTAEGGVAVEVDGRLMLGTWDQWSEYRQREYVKTALAEARMVVHDRGYGGERAWVDADDNFAAFISALDVQGFVKQGGAYSARLPKSALPYYEAFCFLREGDAVAAVWKNGDVSAFNSVEGWKAFMEGRDWNQIARVYSAGPGPRRGDRNVHGFSGRAR